MSRGEPRIFRGGKHAWNFFQATPLATGANNGIGLAIARKLGQQNDQPPFSPLLRFVADQLKVGVENCDDSVHQSPVAERFISRTRGAQPGMQQDEAFRFPVDAGNFASGVATLGVAY